MGRASKRRASESSRGSSDSKKRKASPLRKTTRTSSKDGSRKPRPSPLKSSFKKGLRSPQRTSPPVTFNQAVNYDDGSLTDISKFPITPSSPFSNGPKKALNEDVIATNGPAQTSEPRVAKREMGTGNSKFENVTQPAHPGMPKPNPWFLPPIPTKTPTTTAPKNESPKQLPEKKTPEPKALKNMRPETKIKAHDKPLTFEQLSKKLTPLPKHDSNESGRKVIEEVVREPRALKLEELSDALIFLRDQVKDFGTTHFSHELTAREKRDWPLAALQERNPEFVANCAYIADGGQYGWRKLFTESYCRPQLVTGLIAHYLVEHVFKHTCFGLNEKELASLEDNVLKKYIHWDGFVRSKQLAVEISKILKCKPVENLAYDKHVAVTTLSTSILSTISPLLPPNYKKGNCEKVQLAAAASLQEIISHAQALALSTRLTGANRTVIRFTFPTKHSEYQLGGGQNCLNTARVDATAHHAPDFDSDELRVKIPCWPTIIATVPTGPDMLDFKNDPTLLKRAGKEIPTFTGASRGNPGAYVTEVFLTPSDVYCEWTPLASPLQYPLKLNLWQAIQQAKKERALRLGQPLPPTTPWKRTAARTAGVVLGAAAIGTLAATALAGTTPRGRRLLLHTAKHLAAYLRRRKRVVAETVKETVEEAVKEARVVEDVLQDAAAAAGLAPKASFFASVLGRIKLPVGRRWDYWGAIDLRNRVTKSRAAVEEAMLKAPYNFAHLGVRNPQRPTRPATRPATTSARSEMYDWFSFTTEGDTDDATTGLVWESELAAQPSRAH